MAWKEVSRDEFTTFLASYGAPLERDVYTIAEPPVVQYNDFGLGKWPDSVVAQTRPEQPAYPEHGFPAMPAKFWLRSDEDADPRREEMIRNDAFGDVSGMGRRG